MENYVIRVEKEKETQVKEENIYTPKIFFHDAYHRAAYCVEEILREGQRRDGKHKNLNGFDRNITIEEVNRKLAGYPNNIIAFCAERGQGKTSAMTSFSKALSKMGMGEEEKEEEVEKIWSQGGPGRNYRYEVLEIIEPSMMEDGESIVKIVLSRMFSRVKEQRRRYKIGQEQGNCDGKDTEYARLLGQFQKCFHDLKERGQYKQDEDVDELEQIAELSDSTNMRGTLYRLIGSFLSYLDRGEQSYLVLQVDDADLNIKDAYQIVEDIRRYLVLPRVIILMATNMRQMESVVEQHFIIQYGESVRNGGMVTAESCREIAERYLEKVIPSVRRIYLPDVEQTIKMGRGGITIRYEDEAGKKVLLEGNFEEELLRLLHRSMGIIFLSTKEYLHNLLPNSLRGLSQFLMYFGSLKEMPLDYWSLFRDPKQEDIELWQSNLSTLETYLLETWASVNLNQRGYDLLHSLRNSPDGNKHRHLLWALPEYYARSHYESAGGQNRNPKSIADYQEEFRNKCQEYGLDIYRAAHYGHATFSDVYGALSALVALPDGHKYYKFVYGVRVYYTIRLHQILLKQLQEKTLTEDENTQTKETTGKQEANKLAKYQSYSTDKGTGSNALVVFLGDVLYKREGWLGERAISTPYGHYKVDVNVLSQLIEKQPRTGNWISQQQSRLSQLCRWELQECDYRTRGLKDNVQQEVQEGPSGELVFNIFYPCLWALDGLSEKSEASSELVSALVLLLNCDVQYMLDHTLRHNESYLNQNDGLLRQVFYNVWTYGLRDVLEDVGQITENPQYTELFQWFLEYGRFSERMGEKPKSKDENLDECKVLFALQMSCPKLCALAWRQMNKFKTYWETLDKRLTEIEDKLSQVGGSKTGKEAREAQKAAKKKIGKKTITQLVKESGENGLEGSEAQDLYNWILRDMGEPEMEYMVTLTDEKGGKELGDLTEEPLENITGRIGAYICAYAKMKKEYGQDYDEDQYPEI